MIVQIHFYGPFTDSEKAPFQLSDVKDTDTLQRIIQQTYPQLATATYRLVVNKHLINQNQPLHDGDNIGFLPPFSGG